MSTTSARRRWPVAVGAVAAAVVLAGVAWWWLGSDSGDPFEGAAEAADGYADGWATGGLAELAYAGGVPGTEVAGQVAAVTAELTPADDDRPVVSVASVAPDPEVDDRGEAVLAVRWPLATGVEWAYDAPLPLVKEGDAWLVEWSPAAVHPELAEGEGLRADRLAAERGTILDAAGTAIFLERPVVHVGIATPREGEPEPTAAQLADTAAQVAAVVGVDAGSLQQRVAAAGPDRWVDVVTLRRERYDQVRAEIYDLPGTRFREGTMTLAPTAGFGRAVLGSVGEATAEDIEASGGTVVAGQLVGHGGVQGAFDETLAGSDGVTVSAVPGAVAPAGGDAGADATTSTTTPEQAGAVGVARELFTVEPVRGADVQVTLERGVQELAEAALAGAPRPAALVAVRPSTGELVAVANGGAGDTGFDRALEGRYPPGSTFKVVSTWALLGAGLGPDEVVDCPPTANVGGRNFVNAESHSLGAVPFRADFAESCNTAFVSLAGRVTDAQLAAAAAGLGLEESYDLGVASFGGRVPPNDDAVGHAAAMIGQSTVETSPLGMALAAASVAQGSTVRPVLVLDPAPGTATDATATDGTAPATTVAPGAALDPALVAELRELMREVVTSGTATVLAGVPGPPVHAKTGTAEFGTADPPPTHAWMIGFQGDLAFAVLVEDGGFGAETAGPIAATFLRSLA